MKKVWNVLPAWLKVFIYFIVLSIATLIAGVVPMLNDLTFFFVISLAMSWLFLRAECLSLSTLRCWPNNRKNWRQFFAGIGIGALMLICTAIITFSLSGDAWHFNRHIDPLFIVMGFLFNLWSAYVQEFVFRGYPFQVLLRSYKPWIAQLIIAIPFGLMHVHKAMSPSDIIVTMLTTGIGSLLFGLAYLKTKSLMLPLGIHLGWNFLQYLVPRTAGGIDKGLIIVAESNIVYGFSVVVLPYFVIMIIAFALLFQCSKYWL
ncbi:CPBP family intramembrane glutamic endopeptidase [Pinibacter aurantiacus]|uniref:CPBP family intramembrane metalloprotease n=1 Tax=Pinibacter aurantiacus TaxID=2851599 RepID=A0A9E2SAR0_9BACT|nr:type II CAAX endopeptidase family protein [Pinibacter aurantiacus]MBV4358707.1 CPBP family intramembrane metalloprotease [Pinibacter aurantiacus]